MVDCAYFFCDAPVFHGLIAPEQGTIVGYAAIIHYLNLEMPMPTPVALVCKQNKKYQTGEWSIFPNSYIPACKSGISEAEALYKQLVFALKYEGINLLVFSKLARHYSSGQLSELANIEPTGQYSRRIWFLLEWITGTELSVNADLTKKSYVLLLDEEIQFAIEKGEKSSRHRIVNNLPGTPNFCPLIRKTDKLDSYIKANFSEQKVNLLQNIRKDILQRASAFLLLKDSKASFTIEGESPKSKRAARWGQAIGQAGTKELTKDELLRLQRIVIENGRFVDMGLRKKGGFVGEHDRTTGEPIPDHISAKWQDVEQLIGGLISTNELLLRNDIDAVLAATIIAFGFVFIHPFEDGNGRIHRYLIHHVLAKKQFSQQGIIFPVSASILDHIVDYRKVLESYSQPLLDFIDWEETKDHNINVLNDTADYYKYFDATRQAEFLYDSVNDTIQNIIPNEVAYLTKYDEFKRYLDNEFEMPDKLVALLVQFLEQNNGKLSKRVREKEFVNVVDNEVQIIEEKFKEIMSKESA